MILIKSSLEAGNTFKGGYVMTFKERDMLNEYFTNCINDMLTQLGLTGIQQRELKSITYYSDYPKSYNPTTRVSIALDNGKRLFLDVNRGKVSTNGWYNPNELLE